MFGIHWYPTLYFKQRQPSGNLTKAFFIDRDGVINKSNTIDGKPHAPLSFEDFFIIDGVGPALQKLKNKGFVNIVVTNQPNLSKGILRKSELEKMHSMLLGNYLIDEIYVCPHTNEDQCDCRKPGVGSLLKAKKRFSIDLSKSFMIGDRLQDMECAKNANLMGSFFINYGYSESENYENKEFVTVRSLEEAANLVD